MTLDTVISNGRSDNRIDIVILGDGYTASELSTTFASHAWNVVDYMFGGDIRAEPFSRYKNFFNVHFIETASNERGADVPQDGVFRNTALGGTYRGDGVTDRLLIINEFLADAVVADALSGTGIDAEIAFVTVNSDSFGGSGGRYAVFAGGNYWAGEIALHEVGHSFVDLADTYGGIPGVFPGGEPSAINATRDPSGSKWQRWLGYDQPGVGIIGAYEGALYFDRGVYRPAATSKMRELNSPFDAIAREAFVLEFYEFVDPLDTYAFEGSSGMLRDIGGLFVEPIDAKLIDVEWFVDGTPVAAGETTLSLAALGLDPGRYTITARAHDPTDWVRSDRSALEQTVEWVVELTAPVSIGAPVGSVASGNPGPDGLYDEQEIALLYEVAFARRPDLPGLNFWINKVYGEDGFSVVQIAEAFYFTDTFEQALGQDPDRLSTTQIVEALYANVLDRPGLASHNDAAGYAFWLNAVEGGLSRAALMREFAVSAENQRNSPYITDLAQGEDGGWVF